MLSLYCRLCVSRSRPKYMRIYRVSSRSFMWRLLDLLWYVSVTVITICIWVESHRIDHECAYFLIRRMLNLKDHDTCEAIRGIWIKCCWGEPRFLQCTCRLAFWHPFRRERMLSIAIIWIGARCMRNICVRLHVKHLHKYDYQTCKDELIL